MFLVLDYRWAEFGRYSHILNEQDICHLPWLAYLRSGDRRYLKFAEANTRHLMEVGTIRWNDTWPEYVGMSRRHHECTWLSGADSGHSMLDPFLEMYHATGYRPAWDAASRMARGMANQRSGTWRYISNPVAGLARMYHETQEPFYKEQADRIWNELCFPDKNQWWVADHGHRMVLYYAPLNEQCRKAWEEGTLAPDGRFNGLDVVSARHLATGDGKLAGAVARQVKAWHKQSKTDAPTLTDDPLTRGILGPTQFLWTQARELLYAGATLKAAKPEDIAAAAAPAAHMDDHQD
jgi:hypothetical protein